MSKSKPKNGRTSTQDYMNLLYTDSESDTVPDLKLPPLKGKKPKRRSNSRRPTGESSCTPWMIFRLVTVIILLFSIVALGVITYWSLQQITDLKDQINALDSFSMNGTIDYSALDNEQLIKLDPATRASIQFKPSKRMKKRRQLDALVSNGKKLPRRKQSGHELLRSNDSESSEVEEFSVLESQKWEKRLPGQSCCSTCYTLTCALVVASCLLACAALVWMHLELKQDFNGLRNRMDIVENSNAGTPEQFNALDAKLMSISAAVEQLKTGKNGLVSLNKTIVQMQQQISSLTETTTKLQQDVQSTDSNDKEHKAVADTVADLGSGLQSTTTTVNSLKTAQAQFTQTVADLISRVAALEKPGGREGGSAANPASIEVQELLTQINSTFTQNFGKAVADVSKLQTHFDAVDKFTASLQEQVTNISQQVEGLSKSQGSVTRPIDTRAEDEATQTSLTKLKGQMELLQQSLVKIQEDHGNMSKTDAGSSSLAVSDSDILAIKNDHQDFLTFKTEVYQDMNSLNASLVFVNGSVAALNTDVSELFSQLGNALTNINNVTIVVEGLAGVLQAQKAAKDATTPSPEGKTETSAPSGSDGKGSASEPVNTSPAAGIDPLHNSSSQGITTTPSEKPT